jgi:hypothetical protein
MAVTTIQRALKNRILRLRPQAAFAHQRGRLGPRSTRRPPSVVAAPRTTLARDLWADLVQVDRTLQDLAGRTLREII